jgi:hypothetical protein
VRFLIFPSQKGLGGYKNEQMVTNKPNIVMQYRYGEQLLRCNRYSANTYKFFRLNIHADGLLLAGHDHGSRREWNAGGAWLDMELHGQLHGRTLPDVYVEWQCQLRLPWAN